MAKNEEFKIVERNTKFGRTPEKVISLLERNKRNFYVRETSFLTTLIYDNREFVYTKRNNKFPSNQLWVFRMVRQNAEKFAERVERGDVEFVMPNKYPVNRTNFNYDDSVGEITGTDINSAYWTIAHRMGIITDDLYGKISSEPYKVVRLAALAILGRDLIYKEYKDGLPIHDKKVVSGSKLLKEFYKAIRYTCYEHMHKLSELLGDEFDAYRTDCIYYRNTPENIKLVHDYLNEHGFFYKQLEFEEIQEK
jgi:hypothetical protein